MLVESAGLAKLVLSESHAARFDFESRHLMSKLASRDPGWHDRMKTVLRPQAHPLFQIVPGGVEPWEKSKTDYIP